FRSGGGLLEVHNGVRAVDSFQRQDLDQLLPAHFCAVVFGRPSQQTEEVDECFGEKSGVAISCDADDGSVAALRKFGAIRRDKQGKMSELRRLVSGGLEDQDVLKR